MSDKVIIYNLDLVHNGNLAPFVMKTMEEIDQLMGGIADSPHRHNYYTVIWPLTATGKHIIDFREYPIQSRRECKTTTIKNWKAIKTARGRKKTRKTARKKRI